jgi:hypothetical protein
MGASMYDLFEQPQEVFDILEIRKMHVQQNPIGRMELLSPRKQLAACHKPFDLEPEIAPMPSRICEECHSRKSRGIPVFWLFYTHKVIGLFQ